MFHNICNAGVFTTTIDPQQNKVTVTGNAALETLIRKLAKAGKHAEVLPENLPGKVKDSNKAKNNKNSEQKNQETQQKKNHSSANTEPNLNSGKDKGIENAEKSNGKSKSTNTKTNAGSPEKSPAGGKGQETKNKSGQSDGGDSGKKKMKKTQSGGGTGTGTGSNGLNSASTGAPAHTGTEFQSPGQVVGQVNLSPTRQQSILYPSETGCYPSMVYMSSAYNRLYPMGRVGDPSYHVPSSPYTCPPSFVDQYGTYQVQSGPLVPFELFSDENANGCSIM